MTVIKAIFTPDVLTEKDVPVFTYDEEKKRFTFISKAGDIYEYNPDFVIEDKDWLTFLIKSEDVRSLSREELDHLLSYRYQTTEGELIVEGDTIVVETILKEDGGSYKQKDYYYCHKKNGILVFTMAYGEEEGWDNLSINANKIYKEEFTDDMKDHFLGKLLFVL